LKEEGQEMMTELMLEAPGPNGPLAVFQEEFPELTARFALEDRKGHAERFPNIHCQSFSSAECGIIIKIQHNRPITACHHFINFYLRRTIVHQI
jgi:hypothetical protein